MPNAELQDELVWVLQPSQYAYIRQQNQLVEARYSLTARELKLVLYVCAMADPNAETFGKCQIRVKEFAGLAGVETDALYLELRDTARSVRSNSSWRTQSSRERSGLVENTSRGSSMFPWIRMETGTSVSRCTRT